MAQQRWGLVITGHQFDLQSWSDALKPPFDPWVEEHGEKHVFRSSNFDDLQTPTEVHDAGLNLIAMMNAIMAIDRGALPVTCGGVAELSEAGAIHQHIIMAHASAEARSFARAVAVVLRDGKEIVPKPTPSDPQRWMAVIEANNLIADALTYYSRREWFDIYKALECLKALREYEDLLLAAAVSEPQVKLLTRTANSMYRHRRGKHDPPAKPMSVEEGLDVIGRIIRVALQRIGQSG